jgi:site-specific recombinase XerD
MPAGRNEDETRALVLDMCDVSGLSLEWQASITTWEGWLRAANRPETTIYLRLYHLRRFAGDHPKVHPWEMTLDLLIVWLAEFKWKAETRRSYRSSLRQFYTWGHLTGRINGNPAALLPAVTPPRGRPRPAPDGIFLVALCKAGERERLMLRLAAHTGLRRGEIAKVHTDDLEADLDGWSLRVVGKGGKVRLVPLLDDLVSEIQLCPGGYLFPGKIDGHLSPSYVGKLISQLLEGHWTAHTLRHRFAGKAYAAERDIRAVQELLGHASVVTTQIYTPVPSGALRSAVAAAA